MNWKIVVAGILGITTGWFLRPQLASHRVSGAPAVQDVGDAESAPEAGSVAHDSQIPGASDNPAVNGSRASLTGQGSATSLPADGAYEASTGVRGAGLSERECLSVLRPSSIQKWETAWKQQVTDYLKTNDFLYTAGEGRGASPRELEELVGIYIGKAKLSASPNVDVDFTMRLKGESEGTIDFKASSGRDGDKSVSNCERELDPRRELGSDNQAASVNVIWSNCFPAVWPEIVQFGFKLPVQGSKSGVSQHDLYGLDENFNWKNIGSIEIRRPRK